MKKQKGFTLIELFVAIMAVFALVTVVSWGFNLYKLTDCDFESPYKCEVIHGIGVVPPLSLVTVWFATDSVSEQGLR